MHKRIRAFASILLSIAIAACGSHPAPRPTPAPARSPAQAHSPLQALILGTDTRGGTTAIPLAGGERKTTVDALSIHWAVNGYEGGVNATTLSTAPSTDHEVRVGVFEDVAGGAGKEWRSGVWLASFVATTVLNKDLTDFTFTTSTKGHIDGASASGLMAAGFLATMTGSKIDPAATMTGVIDPDGTIGPVGGIPQKFAAAIAKGKRRLGYPVGMRYAYDSNTRERIDLVALARDQGAEAIEVADVYAAFTLLTGKELPRPVPVSEAAMALDDATIARIEERYARWVARFDEEWLRVAGELEMGHLQEEQLELMRVAAQEHHDAERLMKQGLVVSAYPRMVRAWTDAAAVAAVSDIVEPAVAGEQLRAIEKLEEIAELLGTTEESLRRIGAMKPATMGDHLRTLSAFDAAIGGLASDGPAALDIARIVLADVGDLPPDARAEPRVARRLAGSLTPAMLAYAKSVAAAAAADDVLAIEQSASIDYRCSLPNVRRLARSFASAAGSNLEYLDALAQSARYSDPDYDLARFAGSVNERGGLTAKLREDWGDDSIAWGLFSLAASELSYFRTSVLVSKWYSLGVTYDWTGRASTVEHDKAFVNMLAFAELRARENARAAQVATGEIPLQARLRYQQARMLREGDVGDKLAALEAYWAASNYAQMAVMLARN